MKYTFAICIAALSSICAGQGLGLDNLPDCAKPCASKLPANCGIKIECICASQDWITSISCCVANACSEADQKTTVEVAQSICDVAKVKLPTAAVCPGATGAITAGSSKTTAGSSTATASSTMTGSNTAGSQTMASTSSSAAAAAATAGEAGSSSGAGTQHVAPGLCGVAAIFGLALL
ncbi:MAG: hypothetical protein L6R36_003168 [Xanthoria steineri]|nr:MAG: hypothetical protein L6R36_003168 [Xanthoria steineri]